MVGNLQELMVATIYVKFGSDLRISVPVHKNDDLKIGLLNKLLKLSNIPEDEL